MAPAGSAASVDRTQAEASWWRTGPAPAPVHRHEGCVAGRARRLYAVVPKLEPFGRAGDVHQPRLRSGQKSFTPVANVAWGSWVTVVPASLPVHSPQQLIAYPPGPPRHAQFRIRPGHRAAARRRVVQQEQRPADRGRALQGRHAGDHRHARGQHPAQHRHHGATLLPLIREENPQHRGLGEGAGPRSAGCPDHDRGGYRELPLAFWVGLRAPAGTPPAIVQTLNAATNAALASPEMTASMNRIGVAASLGTPGDFAAFSSPTRRPQWREIVKSSGVRINGGHGRKP